MANIASALKHIRATKSRTRRNLSKKRSYKSAKKMVMDAVKAGDKKEAEKVLPEAYKAIDKAAKANVIHKKTASRFKSRLTNQIKSIK